ncbi:MAG: dihydrofolate reductase family protein [Coprobacillus sp.]
MNKRKVVLYIAISLDGYIADKNGGVDWLVGHEKKEHNWASYNEFISNVDTVIMGYRTYHQIATELSKEKWYYEGLTSYVLTHRDEEDKKEIVFINQHIKELIGNLLKGSGKDIWICGGADIVHQCLRDNLVDEYQITIIPTILGQGVYMFCELVRDIPLYLISMKENNGMVELIYRKR